MNYHQVSEEFNPAYNHPYIWSSLNFFKDQIRYLQENFEIISLHQGVKNIIEGNLNGTKIVLTFDDGDRSVGEFIIPFLTEKRIPASFFINTAYPEEKKGYWFNIYHYLINKHPELINEEIKHQVFLIRNTKDSKVYKEAIEFIQNLEGYIEEENPFYMKLDYWKSLDPELFSVALHGHEHFRFSMLNSEEKKRNIKRNLEMVSDFESFIPFIAFPHGKPHDWDIESLNEALKHGLTPLLANGGYNSSFKNGALLRFSVDNVNLKDLMENLSPFPNRYHKANSPS